MSAARKLDFTDNDAMGEALGVIKGDQQKLAEFLVRVTPEIERVCLEDFGFSRSETSSVIQHTRETIMQTICPLRRAGNGAEQLARFQSAPAEYLQHMPGLVFDWARSGASAIFVERLSKSPPAQNLIEATVRRRNIAESDKDPALQATVLSIAHDIYRGKIKPKSKALVKIFGKRFHREYIAILRDRDRHERLRAISLRKPKPQGTENAEALVRDAIYARWIEGELGLTQSELEMVLMDCRGMTNKQIAEALQLSLPQVKHGLSRARKQLRGLFEGDL